MNDSTEECRMIATLGQQGESGKQRSREDLDRSVDQVRELRKNLARKIRQLAAKRARARRRLVLGLLGISVLICAAISCFSWMLSAYPILAALWPRTAAAALPLALVALAFAPRVLRGCLYSDPSEGLYQVAFGYTSQLAKLRAQYEERTGVQADLENERYMDNLHGAVHDDLDRRGHE